MNIYDEVKVITHEEARNTMMKIESNDAYYGELQEELKLMANYISQQQAKEERAKKEHELLELYREQSKAFFDEDFTKAIIIQNDIDILEEKLEKIT